VRLSLKRHSRVTICAHANAPEPPICVACSPFGMIANIVQKNRSERVGLVPVKTLDRVQWRPDQRAHLCHAFLSMVDRLPVSESLTLAPVRQCDPLLNQALLENQVRRRSVRRRPGASAQPSGLSGPGRRAPGPHRPQPSSGTSANSVATERWQAPARTMSDHPRRVAAGDVDGQADMIGSRRSWTRRSVRP
jgi:hypothetical protein